MLQRLGPRECLKNLSRQECATHLSTPSAVTVLRADVGKVGGALLLNNLLGLWYYGS